MLSLEERLRELIAQYERFSEDDVESFRDTLDRFFWGSAIAYNIVAADLEQLLEQETEDA